MMTRNTSQTPPRRLWIGDRLARHTLQSRLSRLTRGELIIRDQVGCVSYGASDDLSVILRVHDPRFYRHAIFGGTLSIAESYLNGDWDCDELTDLFRILIRNADTLRGLDGALAGIVRSVHRIYHARHANTRRGSRQNIEAHYDLGNDFFELWLDDTMAYSCGIFPRAESTLEDASREKFDRICRRLALHQTDHVLEIGSGWGGFALHAAGHYGCEVTTTTISSEQYRLALERIDDAGLTNRVHILQRDYRDLSGKFEKLVSIEMIEAVGHRYLDTFFGQCGQLLRPDGSMLVQAIVIPERRYDEYLKSVDFIQRYVFPGGCLPAMGAMLASAGRTTDLRLVHVEDFAPHYAETLRRWRKAFWNRIDDVRKLGYSERFIRLWHYYLCYCEAVFEERHVGVLQIQWDKPRCRRDDRVVVQTDADLCPRLQPASASAARELREAPACSRR